MKKQLLLAAAAVLALPALATPVPPPPVVAPAEPTVVVPGLESLGESRISTVRFCSEVTNTDWRNLITDSDFENMEVCLREMT